MNIVIPIGDFSFFVHACLKNIYDNFKDTEVVFITSYVNPFVEKALKDTSYPFRLIKASMTSHHDLLDYAIRDDSLSEWIMVQHCDLFWKAPPNIKTNTNLSAIGNNQFTNYFVNGNKVPLMGDFFGIYNRKKLKDFTFKWGKLGEIPLSKRLRFLIENNKTNAKIEDWVDGSVALSMELIANHHNIKLINTNFYHLMAFYRIWESLSTYGNIVNCKLPFVLTSDTMTSKWAESFACYSYLTSFVFDKCEVDRPMPWVLFKNVAKIKGFDVSSVVHTCEWIKELAPKASSVIGESDCGFSEIMFGEPLWRSIRCNL